MTQSADSRATALRAALVMAGTIAAVSLTPNGSAGRVHRTVAQGTIKAGAAWTDITPLPGLPTGGYGPAGAVTRGYWGRLRAVAFYFEDQSGRGLALVSTDLFAMPSALHQTVAAHFTSGNPGNTTGAVLPLERLVSRRRIPIRGLATT